MQCCCDLASCRGFCLGFPLFPFIGTVSCALLHMRACSRKTEKSKLGKLHGARYLVCPSLSFLSICFPPAETRHLHGLPVFLHLVPPGLLLFPLSLPSL